MYRCLDKMEMGQCYDEKICLHVAYGVMHRRPYRLLEFRNEISPETYCKV